MEIRARTRDMGPDSRGKPNGQMAPLRNSRDPGQELWPSVPLFSAQDSSEPFVLSLARQAWGRRGRQIPDPLGLGDGGDIGDIDDVDDIRR